MKVGDLVRFKRTGLLGAIISIDKGPHYTSVEVLHGVDAIPNPACFTLGNLRKVSEALATTDRETIELLDEQG